MGFIHFDTEDEGMYDNQRPLTEEEIKRSDENVKIITRETKKCLKLVIGSVLSELIKNGYTKTGRY